MSPLERSGFSGLSLSAKDRPERRKLAFREKRVQLSDRLGPVQSRPHPIAGDALVDRPELTRSNCPGRLPSSGIHRIEAVKRLSRAGFREDQIEDFGVNRAH